MSLLVGVLVWPLLLAASAPYCAPLVRAWLPVASWLLPGAVAAAMSVRRWPPVNLRVGAWIAVAWALPVLICAVGVAAVSALGGFEFDPAGSGLVQSWSTSAEGKTALRVVSLEGVAQLEMALMCTAPIYELPRSVSLVVIAWAVAGRKAWIGALAAALVLSTQSMAGFAVQGGALQVLAASVAWSTLGAALSARSNSLLPAVVFAGAVLGSARLVPLLGVAMWPDAVGWSGLTGLGGALILGVLLLRPWRSSA